MKPQKSKNHPEVDEKNNTFSKNEARTKDIENLNRNLMKKLYIDLLKRNYSLYQEKNLSFENFMFNFYVDFQTSLDFENPNYSVLLERMDLLVKAKFNRENKLNSGKNTKEIKKELNLLSQEDDWAIIDRYEREMFLKDEEKRKNDQKLKRQQYLKDLEEQININKNYVDPVEKRKNEISLAYELKTKKDLEDLKIDNQEKLLNLRKKIKNPNCIKKCYLDFLEKENFDINEDNKELITKKIDYLMEVNKEELIGDTDLELFVDKIMKEKKSDNINKDINFRKYQKDLVEQMDYSIKNSNRPCKMSIEERKINKDLLEKAKEYFNQKYKINV